MTRHSETEDTAETYKRTARDHEVLADSMANHNGEDRQDYLDRFKQAWLAAEQEGLGGDYETGVEEAMRGDLRRLYSIMTVLPTNGMATSIRAYAQQTGNLVEDDPLGEAPTSPFAPPRMNYTTLDAEVEASSKAKAPASEYPSSHSTPKAEYLEPRAGTGNVPLFGGTDLYK